MRLLRVDTLQLEYFPSEARPKYAILSHTWSIDEVSYLDMVNGTAKLRVGYKKVEGACKLAASKQQEYIWIDTLCIDKSSSAELSEAINSMFDWYAAAEECYAYIEDMPGPDLTLTESRWFTRGWTLQELIAPRFVMFYDRDWNSLGSRSSLCEEIAKATGIDWKLIGWQRRHKHPTCKSLLQKVSVARKMSWASRRRTTRGEDIAYCLLGIFDANMPLLYGEGLTKAFRRLQELIFRHYDDQSLLAWTEPPSNDRFSGFYNGSRGWMANHPAEFQHAGTIVPIPHPFQNYAVTERGLRISLGFMTWQGVEHAVVCCHDEDTLDGPLALPVRSSSGSLIQDGDVIVRLRRGPLRTVQYQEKLEFKTIFIPSDPGSFFSNRVKESNVRFIEFQRWGPLLEFVAAKPAKAWMDESRTLKVEDLHSGIRRGAICFQYKPTMELIVVVVNLANSTDIYGSNIGCTIHLHADRDEWHTQDLWGERETWAGAEEIIEESETNVTIIGASIYKTELRNNIIGKVTIKISKVDKCHITGEKPRGTYLRK